MKILHSTDHKDCLSRSVLTLGNFDGFHKGHQRLVQSFLDISFQIKRPSVLVTFFPHPTTVLRSQSDGLSLLPLKDFEGELKKLGLDILVIENFTESLSQKDPQEYLSHHLVSSFHPEVILVGENFYFGKDKRGHPTLLKKLEKKHQYQLEEFPLYRIKGEVVSSTRIRNYLKSGNIREAQSFLGREYFIRGHVVKGQGRGREIGYPTINLSTTSGLIPLFGVYFTSFFIQGRLFKSITNVGKAPTFGGEEVRIETHILGKEKVDLTFNFSFGEEAKVFFHHFVRPEKKFKDISSLQKQIKLDVLQAINFHFSGMG